MERSPTTGQFEITKVCPYGHDTTINGRLKYKGCKECNKTACRKYRYRKMYGITVEQFNMLFENQKGCCAICAKHQTFLHQKLSVDHCHKTGRVRGLLCASCNKNIGILENKDFCLKASLYLEVK